MLYETLFQADIFLSIIYFGIISGLVYEIINLITVKNYIINLFKDLLFMLIFSVIYVYSVNIYCFGEFRLFTIVAFIVGFLIERKTIGKFLALFLNIIYNVTVKIVLKINNFYIVKKIVSFGKLISTKLISLKNKAFKKKRQNNEGIL